MQNYLLIITSIFVVTQLIRVIQNGINLHRQKKFLKSVTSAQDEITKEDMLKLIDKNLKELVSKEHMEE